MSCYSDFWKGRSALVTGGSGFVGAYLSWLLLKLDVKVHAVVTDRADPDSSFHYLNLLKQMDTIHLDLTDANAVNSVVATLCPDVIFHLGAKALVPVNNAHPSLGFRVNAMGTVNVLEAARLFAVKYLHLASTDHVFGDLTSTEIPVPESRPVGWSGPYETSKAMAELATRCYLKTYPDAMPLTCITRCSNIFGGGDVNLRRVVPLFVNAALSRGEIPLRFRHNGRSFLDVASVAAGFVRAVASLTEADRGAAKTFHFSHQDHGVATPYLTMCELAAMVAELTETRVVETEDCVDWAPCENPILALDCSWTRAQLGWQPVKPFREALADLCRWSGLGLDRDAKCLELEKRGGEALETLC